MKKLILFSIFSLFALTSFAQEEESDGSTFALALNQDNAFGFYPSVAGSFPIGEKQTSLTFYGLFWTNPTYGNAAAGSDLWLETGVGLAFPAMKGNLLLNPSIGFTHGRLLSGGVTGVAGDGIVPNLVAFYGNGKFEGEFYYGFYKGLPENGIRSDFSLFWLYPGIVLSKNISVGAHYEDFTLQATTDGEKTNFYRWLGGYMKFTVGAGHSFRFSMGNNSSDSGVYGNQYYKLAVVIGL